MPAPAIGPNTLTGFGARQYMAQHKTSSDLNPDKNGGQYHSAAELGINPDGTMGTASRLKTLEPYFGIKQRQSRNDPYSWWDTENHTLPDGLRGKCQYLLNIIITAILTSEMWPVTEALPYKKADSLTVEWDEWRFNDSMLDRTPEEAVARMTTNSKNSFAVHIIRHGKAFMLEHGFWLTPMGQKNWAMNVIQIVNATTETACFGAVVAYLTAEPYVDNNIQFGGRRQNSNRDIDAMMVEETDGFARVQKEENGYNIMVSKMDEIFRNRNGKEADYLIIPPGCDVAIRARPENNYAIYNGVGVINRDPTNAGGRTVRISRGFRVGEKQANIDPHFAFVCIGGYFVMTNAASKLVPISQYCTHHRDVEVFSMSKDDYVRIEYSQIFDYLGLYQDWTESDSPEISWIGQQFLAKYRTWGGLLDAAGEKQRVIDKMARFTDLERDEFIHTFINGQNNVELYSDEFGDRPVQPAGSILNFTQPTVRAKYDARKKATKAAKKGNAPVVWAPAIKSVMTAIIAATGQTAGKQSTSSKQELEFYLKFNNNALVSCNNGTVDFATVPALFLYQAAGHHFVLYDLPYSATSSLGVTPSSFNVALTDRHQVYCARAQLSIAVSVLVGMIRSFNDDKTVAVADATVESAVLVRLANSMRAWLKATKDYSRLISDVDNGKLSDLYNSPHFDRIGHATMTQLPGQVKIPFAELVACVIALSADGADVVDDSIISPLRSISYSLLHTYTLHRGGVQPASSGQFAAVTDNPYEAIISATKVRASSSLALLSPVDKLLSTKATKSKLKGGLTKSLGEFGSRIKLATENALLHLAGGGKKSAAEQAILLDGFRSRFFALANIVGQIWLVNELCQADAKNQYAKDEWYVNILILMSKLPNRSLAVKFLDDILRFVAKKQIEPASGGVVIGLEQLKFIFPATEHNSAISLFADVDLSGSISAYLKVLIDSRIVNTYNPSNISTTQPASSGPLVSANMASRSGYKSALGVASADVIEEYDAHRDQDEDNALLNEISAESIKKFFAHAIYILKTGTDYAELRFAYKIALRVIGNDDDSLYEIFKFMYCENDVAVTPDAVAESLTRLRPVQTMCDGMAPVAVEVAELNKQADIIATLVNKMIDTSSSGGGGISDDAATSGTSHATIDIDDDDIDDGGRDDDSVTASVGGHTTGGPSRPPRSRASFTAKQLNAYLDGIPLKTGLWAKYSMRKNLPMPLGAIGFRLHKQYEMGTAVMMDKGGAAGYTYFGFADFQLGDDIGKKVHVAHFTLYLKSVIMFNRMIVYSRYVISRQYGGGEGTEPWHPLDDSDREDFRHGRMVKDILFAPVLSNFRAKNITMDVTGRFPANMTADQTADDGLHYESAELMRQVWGMQHGKNASIHVSTTAPLFQTIALQEHTQTWNHSKQGYTDVTIDHTHWGPRVYPKCGKVRRGQSSYLERCSWEQTKTLTIGV